MLEDHSDLLADLAQLCFLQLGDIDTVDQHLAGGRPLQQVDAADQRRFPCAGKSDDAEDIPVFDFQVNILARLNVQVLRRKGFIDSDQFYHVPLPSLK